MGDEADRIIQDGQAVAFGDFEESDQRTEPQIEDCPYCFGEATLGSRGMALSALQIHFVGCEECGAHGIEVYERDKNQEAKDRAVKEWNEAAKLADLGRESKGKQEGQ